MVSVPAAQLADRQLLPPPGYVHALVSTPLQVPAQPVPSSVHAARGDRGAPLTTWQVPGPAPPLSLQAWHCPPHATLQQTPSVHSPLAQLLPSVQLSPLAREPSHMDDALQNVPPTQSEELEQLVRQAVAPQMYGTHEFVVIPGQLPVLWQTAASVSVPAEQLAARHEVPPPGRKQLPAIEPLQKPAHVLPSEAHALRVPWGAPVTLPQTPPPRSQASHCPLQAPSQHLPSTQKVLEHSKESTQELPRLLSARHAPPLQ